MPWDGVERRQTIRLHEDDRALLVKINTVLTDPDMGICPQVTRLNQTVYGNGKMGLNTKVILLICAVFVLSILLGADHPWVKSILRII